MSLLDHEMASGPFLTLLAGYAPLKFRSRFTAVVNCGATLAVQRASRVTRGAKRNKKARSARGASVRATISFPSEMYRTLEEIARQKKVSLAWVVREAADQYITAKWPLFKGQV